MRSSQVINHELEETYEKLENLVAQPAGVENSTLERTLRQQLKNLQEEAAGLIQKKIDRNLATIEQGLKILQMVHDRKEKK